MVLGRLGEAECTTGAFNATGMGKGPAGGRALGEVLSGVLGKACLLGIGWTGMASFLVGEGEKGVLGITAGFDPLSILKVSLLIKGTVFFSFSF